MVPDQPACPTMKFFHVEARVETSMVPRAVSMLKLLTSPTGTASPATSSRTMAFFAAIALMPSPP